MAIKAKKQRSFLRRRRRNIRGIGEINFLIASMPKLVAYCIFFTRQYTTRLLSLFIVSRNHCETPANKIVARLLQTPQTYTVLQTSVKLVAYCIFYKAVHDQAGISLHRLQKPLRNTRQTIVSYLRYTPIQRRRSHSGKTRRRYNRELRIRYNNF